MLRRKDKEKIVKELSDKLKEAKSIVFADYQGMSANEVREMKKKLYAQEIDYGVYKKTLIQMAFQKAQIDASIEDYKGPVALVVSKNDEVAGAKITAQIAKENENLKIVGGVLEKKGLSIEEVVNLAKLPEKEVLIARLVGSINAPISNFVGVLSALPRQLVYALKAIEEKKQQESN